MDDNEEVKINIEEDNNGAKKESDASFDIDDENIEFEAVTEYPEETEEERSTETVEEHSPSEGEVEDFRDKYLRLYADFENYRKRILKERDLLRKGTVEDIILELLPSIDHLDIALKHAGDDNSASFVQGVEMTRKELLRSLEKFGLKEIKSEGEAFNPEFHHAMGQVERDDIDANMVVEEMRKGYTLADKVIRASMVVVSKKPEENSEDNEA